MGTMGSETKAEPETRDPAGAADGCTLLEREYVSTEIEDQGDTTASIRLAAARGGRPGRGEEKSPTTGELTASDLRWFGHKATAPAVNPAPVGAPATTYV